jgi:hypothetical protein
MIELNEISNIISDFVQVGYMTAVKAYEPPQDMIRLAETKKWLKMMCIDIKRFKALVDVGVIKSKRIGKAKNSPLYYSKKEIKTALATANLSKLITNKELSNGKD